MASVPDGLRRLPGLGGAGHLRNWTIRRLLPGRTYYWSVQAVDSASAGSPFAAESSFSVPDFAASGVVLPAITRGAVAWGDIDSDGDLDAALAGDASGTPLARIYLNAGGIFTRTIELPGVSQAALAWRDYDNDRDLDLVLAGQGAIGPISRIYRNTSGAFADSGLALLGVVGGALAWGRLRQRRAGRPGDLGMGSTAGLTRISSAEQRRLRRYGYRPAWADRQHIGVGRLRQRRRPRPGAGGHRAPPGRSRASTATPTAPSRTAAYLRRVSRMAQWPGATTTATATSTWRWRARAPPGRSRASTAIPTAPSAIVVLARRAYRAAQWPGATTTTTAISTWRWRARAPPGRSRRSTATRNGTFAASSPALPEINQQALAWGDYDNDDDLDILSSGVAGGRIYRNNALRRQSRPSAPSGLSVELGPKVTLRWNAGNDSGNHQRLA